MVQETCRIEPVQQPQQTFTRLQKQTEIKSGIGENESMKTERIPYDPPADFVSIPTESDLEKAAWRMPNGARHVELIDETEETWERYCAEQVRKSLIRK